jgi:hypothetical protein
LLEAATLSLAATCGAQERREMPDKMDPEKAARIRLLQRAIELSGMSARQFAVQVLIRDERAVRKWLHGDNEVPDVVRDFLMTYVQDRLNRPSHGFAT